MKLNKLEEWLNIQPKNINIKSVFYLVWDSKYPELPVWLDKIPEKKNFSIKVKWKKINKEIIICGFIKDNGYKYNLPLENGYKNIAMIKSLLQKSIRRMDDNIAVQSAWSMIKMDLLAFLRRILIIMVEDVYLHESFSTILWLQCAVSSNLFNIQEHHIKWLLGIVVMLAKNKSVEDFIIDDGVISNECDIFKDLDSKFLDLKESDYSILYSLYFRKSYGGMQSDINLLQKTINIWYKRFNSKKNYKINNKIKNVSLNILELDKDEWIIEAIDFHCCPYMLKWLHDKYPIYSNDYIKELIWNYSSKINLRNYKDIDENKKYKDWMKIKNEVKNIQRYIINKHS